MNWDILFCLKMDYHNGTALFKQEESESFTIAAIWDGLLEAFITDNDKDARQERKIDPDIQDGEEVVIELVLAKNEMQE